MKRQVLLDEKGKEFTSMQFSTYLEKKMHTVPKRLVFVVGGHNNKSAQAKCDRNDKEHFFLSEKIDRFSLFF